MGINIAQVPEYSDADLLKLWRNALALLSAGKQAAIGSRQLTRSDTGECRDMINWLEQRIQDDANAQQGGNVAVVKFNPPA